MARAYPAHPRPSCHALIYDGQRILLVQRASEPFQGYWSLPGGAVELGETVAEALCREVAEETGLQVALDRMLGYKDAITRDPDGRVKYHFVIFYYLARPVGGRLHVSSDVTAAQWVDPLRVDELRTTDAVGQCLRWAGLVQGD